MFSNKVRLFFWICFIVFIVGLSADLIMTYIGVSHLGVQYEGLLWYRNLMAKYGTISVPIVIFTLFSTSAILIYMFSDYIHSWYSMRFRHYEIFLLVYQMEIIGFSMLIASAGIEHILIGVLSWVSLI